MQPTSLQIDDAHSIGVEVSPPQPGRVMPLGDDAASRLMSVEDARRLVSRVAHRFAGRGVDRDDLEQSGFLGYMEARRRADITRAETFPAFASYWIEKAIREAIAEMSRTVRLPRQRLRTIARLKATAATLEARLGRTATPSELAAELALSVEEVEALLDDAAPLSLDALDATRRERLLEAQQSRTASADDASYDWLYRLLDTLDAPTREIIERRYGLNGHEPSTLEAVAQALAVPREVVRWHERQALALLQTALAPAELAA